MRSRIMARRVAWGAWVLVVIQIAGFLFLGSGQSRALVSNLVQIAACFTATAFCILAARRSRDLGRTFWGLFGVAFTAYGISNIIWTYYENWLRRPVPASPVSQFLYLCYDAPIVMALFLREGDDPSGLDWQRSLDFVQMLMVAFLVYYDFLFLRALRGGPHSLEVMEQGMTNILNFVLVVAFLLRARWARTSLVRSLCRRMAIYFLVYAFAAGIGNYALTFIHTTSGSWTSMAWTVPFLVAALLAAGFEQPEESAGDIPVEAWNQRKFLLKNAGLAIMPLTVWALAMRAGDYDHIIAYGAVIISLACYGAHLTISQYRNQESVGFASSMTEASICLLTDVVMREMSGPDLARRLQKARPLTKVLFMSGYTDTAIVHQGVLDPGIAFLPKPFTPSTLAGKVRQVLDQRI